VTAGDINYDGVPDIIVGAASGGGPHVKVIDGTKLGLLQATGQIADQALLAQFYAFDPSFTGGVNVAYAMSQSGAVEIIAGAGAGGGPHVKVIDASKLNQVQSNSEIADSALLGQFYSFSPSFTGGVDVAGVDVDGDGIPDLILAAGPGSAPHIRVVNGNSLNQAQSDGQIVTSALLDDFFAGLSNNTGGLTVGGRI
jgi:hypothetical protein